MKRIFHSCDVDAYASKNLYQFPNIIILTSYVVGWTIFLLKILIFIIDIILYY